MKYSNGHIGRCRALAFRKSAHIDDYHQRRRIKQQLNHKYCVGGCKQSHLHKISAHKYGAGKLSIFLEVRRMHFINIAASSYSTPSRTGKRRYAYGSRRDVLLQLEEALRCVMTSFLRAVVSWCWNCAVDVSSHSDDLKSVSPPQGRQNVFSDVQLVRAYSNDAAHSPALLLKPCLRATGAKTLLLLMETLLRQDVISLTMRCASPFKVPSLVTAIIIVFGRLSAA